MVATVGPWEAKREQFRWRIDHYEPGRNYRVVAYTPDGTTPENEANARLIAASPKLLAGCKAADKALAVLYTMLEVAGLEEGQEVAAEIHAQLKEAIEQVEG